MTKRYLRINGEGFKEVVMRLIQTVYRAPGSMSFMTIHSLLTGLECYPPNGAQCEGMIGAMSDHHLYET